MTGKEQETMTDAERLAEIEGEWANMAVADVPWLISHLKSAHVERDALVAIIESKDRQLSKLDQEMITLKAQEARRRKSIKEFYE